MGALRRRTQHFLLWIFIAVLSVVLTPLSAFAQDEKRSNAVLDITKAVLLDPTTYTPAVLSYTSQRMDWNTSQPLFNAGWLEHNQRFTISGRPDDKPISYEAGNRQITRMALVHLQESVINNVSAQFFERALIQRYPEHRKLLKTLSWVERISFSAYVGYLASVDHFQQAQKNQEMASQLVVR